MSEGCEMGGFKKKTKNLKFDVHVQPQGGCRALCYPYQVVPNAETIEPLYVGWFHNEKRKWGEIGSILIAFYQKCREMSF